MVKVPLAQPGEALCLVIRPKEVRYCLERQGELFAVEPGVGPIDRGVYLVLAELAAQAS
jgi:hypothetical protein